MTVIGQVDGIDVVANEEGIELSKKYPDFYPDANLIGTIKYSDEYMLILQKEEESMDKELELFIEQREYRGIKYCFQIVRIFKIKQKGFTASIEEIPPMYKIIMSSKLFNILARYVEPTFYQNFVPSVENEFKNNVDKLLDTKVPEIISRNNSENEYLKEIYKE